MSTIDSPLQRAAVAVVAVILLSAGLFVAFGGEGQADEPRPIGENATERYNAIDGVSATITTEFTGPNGSTRTVVEYRTRPGTDKYYERIVESETLGSREVFSNGSVRWYYYPEDNEVVRDTVEPSNRSTGERIGELFDRINAKRGATDEERSEEGISPLPAVPAESTTSGPAGNESLRNETDYEVTYRGTDTVDGRETHVLHIEGTIHNHSVEVSNYTQTVWVDAERYYPLRIRQRWDQAGEHYEFRQRYTNVTFDPGLDDSAFEFEPPENATVLDRSNGEPTEYTSRENMTDDAELSLPEPGLPADFTFERGSIEQGRVQSVVVMYTNETAVFQVAKRNRTLNNAIQDMERVTVDDRTLRYTRYRGTHIALWNCGEMEYAAAGQGYSRSFFLTIVTTVECDGGGGDQVRTVRSEAPGSRR